MAAVAGTAFFNVNGVQYSARGNIKISLGSVERESVVGIDQYHGYKEIPRAGYVELDLTDQADLDLNVFENLNNVTVTVQLINGKVAVLRNANQINKLELNADEGQYTVRFESGKGEWIS
jgi:hypothetical protein